VLVRGHLPDGRLPGQPRALRISGCRQTIYLPAPLRAGLFRVGFRVWGLGFRGKEMSVVSSLNPKPQTLNPMKGEKMSALNFQVATGETSITSTAKTVVTITAPANQRVKIKGVSIFGKGTSNTDTPVKVELMTYASISGGTAGSVTT